MMLDLPTLYAVAGMAALVSGVLHLVPWATARFGRWAAWWGGGHVVVGAGSMGIIFGDMLPPTAMVVVPNVLLVIGYAMVLHGVRVFAVPQAKGIGLAVLVAIIAAPMLVFRDPTGFAGRIAYLCVIRAGFDAAVAATTVRLARRRRLHNAWLMTTLFGATVPLFLVRAWLAATGRIGPSLLGTEGTTAAWLATVAISIIMFRGFALLLLDAEDSHRRLTEQLCRDSLTGALNRFGLTRLRAGLTGRVALMTIDLDRFKELNDTQGHAAGDAMLRLAAQVGSEVLDGRGSLVRTGGDEFLGVMPGLSLVAANETAADFERRFARAVAAGMGQGMGQGAGTAGPTLSIGVAEGAAQGGPCDGFDRLLHEADAAMYAVKRRRAAARHRQAA